jgi:demethylmenaquinone methyltransferase/2-methoxy-6-polyprenyl-1,4-benzoquinol methylase
LSIDMESPGLSPAPRPLQNIFTAVPPHYDLVNRIITLGLDKRWRRLASQTCLGENPRRILDVGCGTGDLTINIARLAGTNIEITGLDYSPPMLEIAKIKAEKAGVGQKISFLSGDATSIPFPGDYFDCVCISFAFRNLTYKNPLGTPYLAEVKRVLKQGGRYVIVESSQPENRIIRAFFHFYLRIFVKPVGILLSGNKGAYRYLADSMAHFYSPVEVREMLEGAGFKNIRYRPLLFGAAGIHTAEK